MLNVFYKCKLFSTTKPNKYFTFVETFILFLCKLYKKQLQQYNMLDIGTKITLLRKEKGLSQTELSEKISCSRATLINYEGNKNTPSIETAVKLSQIFDVTLDYLAGKGKFTDYSNDTIKRIEGIQNLDSSTQKQIFNIIDTYLRDSRARIAYAG